MGWRYVSFRGWFEISKRAGFLKSRFPVEPKFKIYVSLEEWKKLPIRFFFDSREALFFPKNPSPILKEKIERLRAGEFQFFNADYKKLGTDYDWIKNPDSGHVYDIKKHWLDINDFSEAAGDIKFVWEKSRFSYLCTIIRYDYHFDEDCSEWVFSEIENWIDRNPINQGPNYKCSQEISLRLLNWIFALYYYKNSSALTEERFAKIMHVAYWQLHHVRQNIHFSRIAVRNNHAITETMMLYLGGIFFPFFPNSKNWSAEGLNWLEEEVAYQVYEDGTFLQFSHNYHRVLVQLLTFSLFMSELNSRKLSKTFHTRAEKTLDYLYQCQIEENGHLSNYGANDGALFFPLNDCEYRDYRPQLNALAYFFNRKDLYEKGKWTEDRFWFANSIDSKPYRAKNFSRKAIKTFPKGGYFVARDEDTLTFIRCGNHKDRPSHADNLHLDIWYKGKNYLRDSGTYKYNTDPETLNFFIGTKGHNTVMLGDQNQMKKGARFIWFHWTQADSGSLKETPEETIFEGSINAFRQIDGDITHKRIVRKTRGKAEWKILDTINRKTDLPLRQIWNLHPDFFNVFEIDAIDENSNLIEKTRVDHFYSSEYGVKEISPAIIFETKGNTIRTTIRTR